MPFFGKHVRGGAATGLTFVALAARGSGNSGALEAPICISFEVRVTVAGTTLAVQLEESDDGTTWAAVGAAVNQNGAGTSARAQRTIQRRYMRFVYTITGANYTFAIEGDAKGGL
jgi:hypothetical protein